MLMMVVVVVVVVIMMMIPCNTSAYMINRTMELSSGTIIRFPLPPNDTDDSCVSQQTDSEYDAHDALPVSTEPLSTPLLRF